MPKPQPTLLVTGASGYVGSRVVETLLKAGVKNLIVTTRHPEQLHDMVRRGVTVRHADFNVPATLKTAFMGAERVLLISTNTLGKRVAQHTAALAAAVAAGVKHVTYTSFVNAEAPGMFLGPEHFATESLLRASGLGFTFLRSNLYTDAVRQQIASAREAGTWVSASGDGGVAYVTREDCARAAAAALMSQAFDGQTFDVTGPRAVTACELAALAGVDFVAVSGDELKERFLVQGLPVGLGRVMAALDRAIAAGLFARVTTDVKLLTGTEPISLGQFLSGDLV